MAILTDQMVIDAIEKLRKRIEALEGEQREEKETPPKRIDLKGKGLSSKDINITEKKVK